MHVANILKSKGSDVLTMAGSTKLSEVARSLAERKIGAIVIVDDGKVAGILSERDIVSAVAANGAAALDQEAHDIMTRNVVSCTTHDNIEDLMGLMTDKRIRHLPVIEDGDLKGIISIGDVVKRRIAETEAEAEALREYIATG